MLQDVRKPWFERMLAPYALFLGVAVSFLVCCIGGQVASGMNYYQEFERFHWFIGPESYCYPTASQVRAIARSRLVHDKIAVVVGGNSILYGTGQRGSHVWTKELQTLLGDRYRVINLAMRAATTGEFGATAAEFLENDYQHIILISDLGPSTSFSELDGAMYPYFFWDAYYKGLVPYDQAREDRLQELARARRHDDKFHELQRRMVMDGWLHFQDGWAALTYTRFSPQWSPVNARFTTAPRKFYPDSEQPPPLEKRYPPETEEFCMKVARGWAALASGTKHTDGTNPTANVQMHPFFSGLASSAKHCVPESGRARTLLLVMRESPYYLNKLNPAEQDAFGEACQTAVRVLEEVGFSAQEIGRNYTPEDFVDRCHLSETGGKHLAEDVAPMVRALAESRGYLKQGESR